MKKIILSTFLLLSVSLECTFSDSRFIPWYQQTFLRDGAPFSLRSQLFFVTGDNAYGSESVKKRGIPEVYGLFDQRQMGLAAQAVGAVNPLDPIWQLYNTVKWNMHGKIQGQGTSFSAEYKAHDYITLGIQTNFIHISSSQKFVLPVETIQEMGLTAAQQIELDDQRRQLLRNLGFTDNHWSRKGFSDTLFYVRLGTSADYSYKCKFISLGTTFGLIAPTSKQRDIKHAAAIPFHAEDMAGFTWGIDAQSELKEDLWVGGYFSIGKRFSKIQERRLSVKGEAEIFGATQGDVYIDPGVTVSFSPFIRLNDIRDRFNFHLQYVYQFHARDVWSDKRINQTIPVTFTNNIKTSRWESEYLLFKIGYDYIENEEKNLELTFGWDIPLKFLKPEESVKAQKVSIGFEYNF